ncbi:MAG: TraB/GumN family protein [Boseongicola sp.]|nr:TraB/GumN family protein [Boseongicola sp.]NNJ67028.1 TraB/GumN family protein [Boseongicola sp.]
MVRRFLTIIALALTPFTVAAQSCGTTDLIETLNPEERARLDALVAPHAYPVGNLWRAEKDGSTVVVAGTLHVPDLRLDALTARIDPFLRDADLLVLEASSEDEAGLAAMAATKPELFFITDGPTLIDLLSEEDWTKAEEQLAALGIPAFVAAQFQPWYMNLTLAIPPCALALVQSGAKGLDRQLEDIALESDIPVSSLDNVETVIRIFADAPFEDQMDGLRLTLNTTDEGNANTSTLIEAYFDGRTREGWEFGRIMVDRAGIENGQELFDEVNTSLLVERNQNWEPLIHEMVEGKDAVIAVGAAHLSGETGVLRALERAGYALEAF